MVTVFKYKLRMKNNVSQRISLILTILVLIGLYFIGFKDYKVLKNISLVLIVITLLLLIYSLFKKVSN